MKVIVKIMTEEEDTLDVVVITDVRDYTKLADAIVNVLEEHFQTEEHSL